MAAVKLHIPVVHVEAGNRFNTLDSPEEVNRIVTDHVSSIRFACTHSAMESLIKENLESGSYISGDPMYDAFLYYKGRKSLDEILLKTLDGTSVAVPERFNYLTCHRQENTQTDESLRAILQAMEQLGLPAIYPVHPRNHAAARRLQAEGDLKQVLFVEPVGYLESNTLVCNADRIVTDSGGVQREAFFASKPCVTVFDYVAWPETMTNGCNQLAKADTEDILGKCRVEPVFDDNYKPFGNGDACKKIVEILRIVKL